MAVAERTKDLLPRVDEHATAVAVVPQRAAETTPATMPPADSTALMFERLAKDPTVDVDKLERLIAMQERIIDRNAKADFYADFARMQGELPTVLERGKTNNGAYARHEDIIEAVRGVLKAYGFIVTFRTEFPDSGSVKVVGVLAHRSGHTEDTEFIAKPDTSGNKNAIQAVGSAISYGQRYTMRSLLNIASSEDDDDGRKAGAAQKQEAAAPSGYDDWLANLETVALEGMPAFAKMWNESKDEYRKYLASTAPRLLANIKTKAAQVKAAR